MIYKLSAPTEAEIKAYLVELCEPKDDDGNPAEWQQYLSNRHKGIHNCVYLGQIVDSPAEYDEEGNVITEPTYHEGYHADVMTDTELDLPSHITRHEPKTPKHSFA